MSGIKGKVVAITGASSGIGEATARHLAAQGAKVVLGARRDDRLKALATELEKAGGEAEPLRLDVTRRDDVLRSSSGRRIGSAGSMFSLAMRV